MSSTRDHTPVDPARDEDWRRELLFAAMLDEVAEHGFHDTKAAAVAARAGLDEQAFRSVFPGGKEECLLAAFDSLTVQAYAHIVSAYRAPRESREASLRAALLTVLRGIYARPRVAQVYLRELPTLGARAQAHHNWAVMLFAGALAEMLRDTPSARGAATPGELHTAIQDMWRTLARDLSDTGAALSPQERLESMLAVGYERLGLTPPESPPPTAAGAPPES